MMTIKKVNRSRHSNQSTIIIIAHPRKIRNKLKNSFLEILAIISFIALPGTLEYIEQGGNFLYGFLTFWAALGYLLMFAVANTVWEGSHE